MIVELIPKQEQKPIFGQVFFLIVSIAVLASVAIAYFILSQLIETGRADLDALERQFLEDTRPLEQELSAKLADSKQRVEDFVFAAGERRNLLPFFGVLEGTTHPEVFFLTLRKVEATNTLVGTGEAQSFVALEQQRLAWKKEKRFESFQLKDIRLTGSGTSGFTVEFTLHPELLAP